MPFAYSTADYLALPRNEEPFLITDLMPVEGAMLIYGDPKVGKSFAALQLAAALATGTPWLGFTIPAAKPVLYVQLDTPQGLWMQRIEALTASGETGVSSPHIWQADRQTLDTWPFNILNPEHAARLRGEVDRIKPCAVFIDTLKECNQQPENDNTEGQRVVAALSAATQPAALIIIHHSRKPSDGRPNDLINGARGASYLTGRMDAIVNFSQRSMHYISRSVEGGTVKLDRNDNGFWSVRDDHSGFVEQMNEILAEPDLSLREKARKLAAISGRSEEACRSTLRRAHFDSLTEPLAEH